MIGNARIRLRPTLVDDLDYVLTVENDPVNRPAITPWERTQHEAAVRFPDFRHFIVEAGDSAEPAGFVILVGCRSPHRSIELKRMVIQRKGEGLGRACLRLLKKIAFEDLGAHRFWLDVKVHNVRAKALYDKEGFVEEGRLRECVRTEGGYESLVVMSLLDREYAERRRAGLEDA
ncbi:GNAT family N-acetyltransferase [Caldimonas thermodepolymerans]|jgi:diamine N-acetyltransferase|uniref:GNAT family N-acetyltransferase n=1 Tax=Caldimonas thermodepolymerans TaxID=215580 RepID=UPI0022354D61|nr:GNAT family protein [Caldimonas thermodepolymerans]UZG43170.1 GNAT family N-acetyltransferase [Caldimonas thermodepolymerans]